MRLLLAIVLFTNARGQSLPGVEPRVPEAPVVESLPPVRPAGDAGAGGELLTKRLTAIHLLSPRLTRVSV